MSEYGLKVFTAIAAVIIATCALRVLWFVFVEPF